jgi:hypothetical protein
MNASTFQSYYTDAKVAELRQAFTLVHDPADWKAPIAAWVQGELVNVTVEAIEFFTATPATVQLDVERMLYLVTSVGYRAGPAGP